MRARARLNRVIVSVIGLLEKVKSKYSWSTMVDNILWTGYMCAGKYDEAKKVWDSSLSPGDVMLHFRGVAGSIKRTGNIELGKQLCSFLESKPTRSLGAIGVAKSMLLSAYGKSTFGESLWTRR